MKRWCRLSALQAKQALGHVHTWHCGTSASASATAVPLPTSLPKASSVYCALDLTCAALEPRPTHHLLVAPAPAQAFAGTALLAFPPDPATLNLSRERFPFSCGRCEQNKLFDADRRAQALGDHHQRDHRPRHHRLRVPRRHLPNRSLRPRRRPPSPPPPSPPPPSVPPSTLGLASAAVRLRHPYHPDRHRQHPHPHHHRHRHTRRAV